MDSTAVIPFPSQPAADDHPAAPDSVALAEIDAAILLVVGQAAKRVRLTAWPCIEDVAAIGLARARAEGVAFAVEHSERPGVVTVTIGPLE